VKFANRRFDDARKRDPDTTDFAALLSWEVDRNILAQLDNLSFVRGDRFSEDYWQFVSYCWGGTNRHKPGGHYYDIVYGPVNTNYLGRRILPDSDQISFHTPTSVGLLESSLRKDEVGAGHLIV